ncbi:unnamed protein product [Caenorhabditis auriculariae]|uniref:Laminin EGF-like domain-containing protein n=1 Tax=Caenorhabditis auriculariae TaxID=2777116 RepID=A0A8S1HM50_9PELO|nr:unnamed protein product [Caenorhabditis auriculariae]
MTTSCPPHWAGPACDWPLCVNGKADAATRKCVCRDFFAQPFCISCAPGYWGEKARLAVPPVVTHVILVVLVILAVFIVVCLAERIRRQIRKKTPPPYAEVVKDLPPPYEA